ncbi:Homeodomain-interacting protein kinase 2 [Takifugu flavidus]|uniref:Homeodomain-interacting protein kinase 2 n=1 Tax=Takifugu flavidus TaxID=433684 RepID=A0A5C6NM55_9TELE|nr:Homeodomain-interacting protein kinase 2 [Takifugu flavidus]
MEENNFRPLPLKEIRFIVQQLAVALQSLRSVGLTHCDIKLDNIMLVDHEKQPFKIKLIDFGVARVASTIPQGSAIQVLCYRSPEVLLGLPLTEAVDIWSLGCVVAMLHLGNRLFDGDNEFDVMRYIVELFGQPPNRMLNAGIKTNQFFKQSMCAWNRSWKLKTGYSRGGHKLLDSLDDILSAFPSNGSKHPELNLFVNMLKKMLDLDPATRITPAQLLQHGFLTNTDLGGLPLPSVSRGTFVLRRTPESSPVQEDCSVLRTHRCSEFPAVQGDSVWFGDSPMDLGRADAASRSPCDSRDAAVTAVLLSGAADKAAALYPGLRAAELWAAAIVESC